MTSLRLYAKSEMYLDTSEKLASSIRLIVIGVMSIFIFLLCPLGGVVVFVSASITACGILLLD